MGLLALACGPTAPADRSEATVDDGMFLCVWHDPVGAPGCVDPPRIEFYTVELGERDVRRILIRNRTASTVVLERQISGAWLAASGLESQPMAAGDAVIVEVTLVQGAAPGEVVGRLEFSAQLPGGGVWTAGVDVTATVLGCPSGSMICDDGSFAQGCDCPLSCDPNFWGPYCSPCPGMPDDDACSAHGWCDDGAGGAGVCYCAAGWTDAQCATDIDECPLDPCSSNATCKNLPGSFLCTCNPGFAGDGLSCSPAPCPEAHVLNGSDLPWTLHGASVGGFVCDDGYGPVPAAEPSCSFGEWTTPSCLLLDGQFCAATAQCVNSCIAGVCGS